MSSLFRMQQDGFSLSVFGGKLLVTPAKNLSDQQRSFIKKNKTEIIKELEAEEVANNILRNIVTCYTPAGNPIEVEAENEEHVAWLEKMNPKVIP